MRVKIILFDIDGVIVRPPYYFGKELETQGYTNAEEILNNFFVNENAACTEGRVNIEDIIGSYLEKIGWRKSIEAFFEEQFDFEAQFFDQSFINIIQQLQQKGILCYLASAQEKVRAHYFLQTLGFDQIFDAHYISCDIGYRKDKPEYWEYVLSDLQNKYPDLELDEVVFFDDGKKNVELAHKFGIRSFLFVDMKQFEDDLKALEY